MHPNLVLDLGTLTQPIFTPEIAAAANCAFKNGKLFAKLTTPDGGELLVAAKPALEDTAPVKVQITGAVTIVASAHHPIAPLAPVHPRAVVSATPPRAHLLSFHSAQ